MRNCNRSAPRCEDGVFHEGLTKNSAEPRNRSVSDFPLPKFDSLALDKERVGDVIDIGCTKVQAKEITRDKLLDCSKREQRRGRNAFKADRGFDYPRSRNTRIREIDVAKVVAIRSLFILANVAFLTGRRE